MTIIWLLAVVIVAWWMGARLMDIRPRHRNGRFVARHNARRRDWFRGANCPEEVLVLLVVACLAVPVLALLELAKQPRRIRDRREQQQHRRAELLARQNRAAHEWIVSHQSWFLAEGMLVSSQVAGQLAQLRRGELLMSDHYNPAHAQAQAMGLAQAAELVAKLTPEERANLTEELFGDFDRANLPASYGALAGPGEDPEEPPFCGELFDDGGEHRSVCTEPVGHTKGGCRDRDL